MKNVYELYKNYYNAYKSNFDTYYDELTEDKKKGLNYKQFELDNEILSRLMLLKWVKVNERRFNEILSRVTEAKNNGLKINKNGREFTLDNTESLLKDIDNGKMNKHEFKKRYSDIIADVKGVLNDYPLTTNQKDIIEILLLAAEMYNSKDKKTGEQSNTTDMSELESKKSAEQRRNQQGKG